MAHTIEFYLDNQKIMVDFNSKKYPIETFLLLPEANSIIKAIFFKIKQEYMDQLKKEVKNESNMGEVVGAFIKKYCLKNNDNFDIVILGNGSLVKFNIE